MIVLQDAVDDLYRLTVIEERRTSTKRLDVLADCCVQELSSRGQGSPDSWNRQN